MLRARFLMLMVLTLCAANAASAGTAGERVDLAGTWNFRLDPKNAGIAGRWFNADLPDRISLPGSTDEAGYGTPNTRPANYDHLSRLVEYTGPAWYERSITVPETWRGKRVSLFLERAHWETRAWVDGKPIGMRDSLSVAHVYDLGALEPGPHRLTVRVDNTLKYNMGPDAHSTSEQTQTNWNGIIGRIELMAADPVRVESIQVYPDAAKQTARVALTLGNATGTPATGLVTLAAESEPKGHRVAPVSVPVQVDGETATVEATLPMGNDARLWDEFSPTVYRLIATVSSGPWTSEKSATFGLRDLTVQGNGFAVNGRRIFLRGTLDCCVYPLTGYPPTTRAGWERVFKVVKSYGLNHVRYHSWCPPEEAFDAADRMGILLHVEAPWWAFDVGKDPPRDDFIKAECRRILDTYGNHPSFGFFVLGNELEGDGPWMEDLVAANKARDPRHLYTASTWHPYGDEDQFEVDTVRGLHGPTTNADFRAEAAKRKVPLISHEIGQWSVYPRMAEIPKYKGVLRARNFEKVRDDLKGKGMLDQAAEFTRASGLLSRELYKEEVEVMLRTGHAGFQLLDLHDFPGQGTAVVGMLDAFWESKGLIRPEEWRRFCAPTVPLARLARRTFTTDEPLTASVEVAHYGPRDLQAARASWTLTNERGRVVAKGELPAKDIPTGANTPLGEILVPLSGVSAPVRLKLTVSLPGTDAANDWNVWVYPPAATLAPPDNVMVTRDWPQARSGLAAGRRVLFLPSPSAMKTGLPGSTITVFWSPVWFKSGAGTMGLLVDAKHPALDGFPTDGHQDWQWFDPVTRSQTMVLDGLPGALRPIVQVVDNFTRNQRLGNLFEARVGNGRLLVSSMDLSTDVASRPAAAQLLRSLLDYTASDRFRPTTAVDAAALDTVFWDKVPLDACREDAPDLSGAMLDIRAAVRAPDRGAKWAAGLDEVVAKRAGFGYSVQGSTWKDGAGYTWFDPNALVMTVDLPKGFTGTLHVHLWDYNNLNRMADVDYEGRPLGLLEKYGGDGVWLALPVTAADSADGKIALTVRPRGYNATVARLALVAKTAG